MHFTHHIQQTTSSEHKFKEVKSAHPTKLKIEYIFKDEDAPAAVPTMTEPFMSKNPTKCAKPMANNLDYNSVQEVSAAVGTKCTQQTTVSYGAPEPQKYFSQSLC